MLIASLASLASLSLAALISPTASGLPSSVAAPYLSAEMKLALGDEAGGVAAWRAARTAFDKLPVEEQLDEGARRAAAQAELRLAALVEQRFDRVALGGAGDELGRRVDEKGALFVLLAGNGGLSQSEPLGAYRKALELDPTLRDAWCKIADVTVRYFTALASLPCPSTLRDDECELFLAKVTEEDVLWKNEAAHADAQCRAGR